VTRVPAQTVERVIVQVVRARYPDLEVDDAELLDRHLSRAVLDEHEIKLSLRLPGCQRAAPGAGKHRRGIRKFEFPGYDRATHPGSSSQDGTCSSDQPDLKLIQAVVRAHCWTHSLVNADFASIEELAASIKLHPKVVRNDIRLAFLAPTSQIPF